MVLHLKPFAIVVLLALLGPAVAGEAFTGRVIAIADGDTLTVLTPDKRRIRVRLAEIDTPERRQPYGTRARQALAALVFGKGVQVEPVTVDRYGRTVARVYVEHTSVNREMVCAGHAWVYRRYATDPALYECERRARQAKAGLWALPQSETAPPWEWRRAERKEERHTGPAPGREPAGAAPACGPKRYCKQMANCAEARFYLRHCGLGRLDGDKDGVPCEALCRRAE